MDITVIPLMREAMKSRLPAGPVNPKGPAIITLLVFFSFASIGIILRLITGVEQIFLISFLVGSLLSSLIYVLSRRLFRSHLGAPHTHAVLSSYDPLIGRFHGWGFEAAANMSEDILRNSLTIAGSQNRSFVAIDDCFHSFVVRLHQLGQSKLLIGSERELKRHCEKLSVAFGAGNLGSGNSDGVRIELAALELRLEKLEQISQGAVLLTKALRALLEAATPLWSGKKMNVADVEVHIRNVTKVKTEFAPLINAELAKIGL